MGLLVQLVVQCAGVMVVTSDPQRLYNSYTTLTISIPTQTITVAPQPYPNTTQTITVAPQPYPIPIQTITVAPQPYPIQTQTITVAPQPYPISTKQHTTEPPQKMREIDFESIGGEAKSTSIWDNNWMASNAFTHTNHGWHNAKDTSLPQNLWYEFDYPKIIKRFAFKSQVGSPEIYGPSSYTFWGSNGENCSNESTRETLFNDLSDTAFTLDNAAKVEDVDNINFYKCYGFEVVKSNSRRYTIISNVRMYHTPIGLSNFEPDTNQCSMTAKQIVMTTSGASATRGIFISLETETIFKIRRQGIDVLEDIELLGPTAPDRFFSREFEKETSSNDFLKVVNILGSKVAVTANYKDIFVKVEGGVTVNHDKEKITEQNTTSHNKYMSAIKVYNVPIKSIDLDPRYIRLNQEVLTELTEIEEKISINAEDQTSLFNEYFKKYGTHYIYGLMELGGSIIIKSEASFSSNSNFDTYKENVKKSTDAYADLSVTAGGRSGGGSVKTNANELKDVFSSKISKEILQNISLEKEKIGGPHDEDEIDLWKKGLVEQCDTWRIIDKPTDLITTWDLILLHHINNFTDAKKFTSLMKKAWETIIEKDWLDLPSEFKKLGISTATANKRRQLLVDMMSQGPVVGVKDITKSALGNITKSALVSRLTGGHVVLPALQLQEKPLDHNTTSILPFDSIKFLPERPYKVYLSLEHNNQYLGDIIIVLNGPQPKFERQFLELSTGDNNVGGAWRGSGFDGGVYQYGEHGEWIECTGYRNASGLQTDSLFPLNVERTTITPTRAVVGQVLGFKKYQAEFGIKWDTSEFHIVTKTPDYAIDNDYNFIGQITSGLDILQTVIARSDDYVKDVKFSDCGLVVID